MTATKITPQTFRTAQTVLDMATAEMRESMGGSVLAHSMVASMLVRQAVQIYQATTEGGHDEDIQRIIRHGVTVAITGKPQPIPEA